MTDKEKIRAEIVRHLKEDACGDEIEVYNELLSFIDSMQKEPETSVWHDNKDTPVASKTKIVLYTNGKWDLFKAYKSDNDFDNYWASVNQSLEEKGVLVKQWAYVDDLLTLSNLETTKESKKCIYSKDNYTDEDRKVLCDGCKEKCEYIKKEEPVSEDLEKASYYFACKCHPLKTEYSTTSPNPDVKEAFKAGAKWQKEQMIAKAFDGNATFEFYGLDSKTYGTIAHDPVCFEDLGLKDTDKVKVIVIKEK